MTDAPNFNAGDLTRLVYADGDPKATQNFVAEMIQEFDKDNRVIFLTAPNKADDILARIRIRIARARNDLEKNRIPRKHFGIKPDFFPYTNARGQRLTAIVLRKIVNRRHQIKETMEGIVYGHEHGRVDSEKPAIDAIQTYEW